MKRTEAFVLGIPFVNLVNQKIDFSVLSFIPETIARNYNIVAYTKSEHGLEVAMLDVDDLPVIDFIKKRSGSKILPRFDRHKFDKSRLGGSKSLKRSFKILFKKNLQHLETQKTKKMACLRRPVKNLSQN